MTREALRVTTTVPVAPTTLYYAWLDAVQHTAMTGGTAKLEAEVGAKFSALGGYITGQIVALDLGRRILMSWRTSDFPSDAPDSRVEVHFEALGGSTRILVLHSDIPAGQAENYRGTWNDKYFQPMRIHFSKFLPDPRLPPPVRKPPPPPEPDEEEVLDAEERRRQKLGAVGPRAGASRLSSPRLSSSSLSSRNLSSSRLSKPSLSKSSKSSLSKSSVAASTEDVTARKAAPSKHEASGSAPGKVVKDKKASVDAKPAKKLSSKPASKKAAKPTKPAKPSKPASKKAAKPTKPAKPSKPAPKKAAKPTKPAKPSKPAPKKAAKPAKPSKSAPKKATKGAKGSKVAAKGSKKR